MSGRGGGELRGEPRHLRLGLFDRGVLHRPVAADLHRRLRKRDEIGQPRRIELAEHGLDQRLVPDDQRTLGATFGGVAEYVECRAAQPLQPREQPQRGLDPWPECALLRPSSRVALRRQEGRREVILDREVAVEFEPELVEEAGPHMQPRHLVLVLVGHQLEQRARHGVGQRFAAERGLGAAHAVDGCAVACGIRVVLVGAQEVGAPCDHLVERLRCVGCRVLGLRQEVRIGEGEPAPGQGLLVALDRDGIELDRTGQRLQRHRHQALLPGKAEHHDVGVDAVAEQSLGQRIGVDRGEVAWADHPLDGTKPNRRGEVGVAEADHVAGRHLGDVDRGAHTPAIGAGRLGRRTDHEVAADQGIRRALVDPHLVQRIGRSCKPEEAQHRAEFLREAGEVEHRDAATFEMRGHRDQRADRDDAGAADPGDEEIIGRVECRELRRRQRGGARQRIDRARALGPSFPALDGDKARAEAVEAGEILVAGRQVDLALAAERRLLGLDAEAIGFHRAIAAALADEVVDVRKPCRIDDRAALAPPPLLGGAGLLIDQHGDAGHLAQLTLHGVHVFARMDRDASGQIRRREMRGIIRHQRDPRHTLGAHGMRDRLHADRAVDRLTTGHGDCVVEQDLVGDVGLRRDRLADRHRAGVIIGAFAEILEHMRIAGEFRRRCPIDAFAAHLDQRRGLAVHPARHEMAADASQRRRAFGHFRRRVVRAARAEIRRARSARHCDHAVLLGHERGDATGELQFGKHRIEPPRQHVGQHPRRQFAGPGDQPRAGFVMLADHPLRLRPGIVVEVLLELALDDAALLLDHQDLALALHELHRVVQRQRPHHADLVDVDAEASARGFVEPDQPQRLHQIQMRLASRDDAVACVLHVVDPAVDRIGFCKGIDRVLLGLQPFLDLRARQIRPAIMQAARWRHEIRLYETARCRQRDRGTGLHDLRDRLEADPHAGKSTERVAIFAEREILADIGRMQCRHEPAHESDVGLMRHRGRHATMVVAGDDQHAAVRRGAIGIAVLQRVAGAIDARTLAIPQPEHAIDLTVFLRLDLLRAEHRGRREVLVHGGQEFDAAVGQQLLDLP